MKLFIIARVLARPFQNPVKICKSSVYNLFNGFAVIEILNTAIYHITIYQTGIGMQVSEHHVQIYCILYILIMLTIQVSEYRMMGLGLGITYTTIVL